MRCGARSVPAEPRPRAPLARDRAAARPPQTRQRHDDEAGTAQVAVPSDVIAANVRPKRSVRMSPARKSLDALAPFRSLCDGLHTCARREP